MFSVVWCILTCAQQFAIAHSSIYTYHHHHFASLINQGGDWDRRNRLKVYKGTYHMAIRDFKTAATLFLDTIATFTSYELMHYKQFVVYTVLCSMIALSRPQLRDKVIKGAEILEVSGLYIYKALRWVLALWYGGYFCDAAH